MPNGSFTFSKICRIQLCHSHLRRKSEEVSTDYSARQLPSKELAARLKVGLDPQPGQQMPCHPMDRKCCHGKGTGRYR
jgi:hypothetical protein